MEGRRYPLGIQTFKNIIEGNYVYVDKTDLIYELVHEKKYYLGNTKLKHSFPYLL